MLTTREKENHWERARQEEELAQHQEERMVQIDLMKARLEGATLNSVPRQSQIGFYFRKLTESDDIHVEAYLTTFERLITSEKLEHQHWAFQLAPYLTGKAQRTYAALNSEEAADYTKLKEAILHKCNIITDSYRQQFRSTFKKYNESYQELVIRMGNLVKKWLKDCTTVERPGVFRTAFECHKPPLKGVFL